MNSTLFNNDAVLLGVLMLIITAVFTIAKSKIAIFDQIFKFVPPLLWCYILPSLLNHPLGLVNVEESKLYFVVTRYLLPAALILLSLGVNFSEIIKLGKKSVLVFLGGTLGVILGGPIALKIGTICFPSLLPTDGDSLWKGLSTIAGSWIGGNANQTAMKETFDVPNDIFTNLLIVDTIGGSIIMALLLWGVNHQSKINRILGANNDDLEVIINQSNTFMQEHKKPIEQYSILQLMGIVFGGVALSHFIADYISQYLTSQSEFLAAYKLDTFSSSFFWVIILATTIGLIYSINPKIRSLEGLGASKIGGTFIYLMVATIGLNMDLSKAFQYPGLLLIGFIWLAIHLIFIFSAAKILKAPYFYLAVGSQSNIGGTASAPIVAAAFNPSLATIGVLMAVLGNIIGTYCAIISAYIMQWIIS